MLFRIEVSNDNDWKMIENFEILAVIENDFPLKFDF